MNNGWVKIHRKIKDKPYYNRPAYISLWVHILLSVNHKEKEFMWNKELIIIKEGQFITGRKELSKELGVSESSIERILKCFENEHQIEQQKTNKFRLITVINWKEYQSSEQQNEQQMDNKRTTDGQQMDTNKNDKNVKNEKNILFSEFWDLYDKKIGRPKSEIKWNNFSLEVQKKILAYLPRYKSATPDKKFRKNPETFFNNKAWEDELVGEKDIKPTHWAGELALYGDSDIQDKLNKKIIKFNQSTKKYERF